MSAPPITNGTKKLPKPPIIAGITIKNIITIACAVIILLYNWLSDIYWTPGADSSNLISTEKAVPIKPDNKAKIRYKTPISFAFDDQNHLSSHKDILFAGKFKGCKGCKGCSLEVSESKVEVEIEVEVEIGKKKQCHCMYKLKRLFFLSILVINQGVKAGVLTSLL